jgi:hypothetical protein
LGGGGYQARPRPSRSPASCAMFRIPPWRKFATWCDTERMAPTPKAPSKRRRRNVPKCYGAAEPAAAPAAPVQDRVLGFDAHPLILSLWTAVQESCEARFYSAADWQR